MIVRAAVFPFLLLRPADCLLALTCSTAGCPQGILAGSPRVGETGRWPAVVTMVMTASICQGSDCQSVASACVLSLRAIEIKYVNFRAEGSSFHLCLTSHSVLLFSLISVLKNYLSGGVCLIWLF